MTDTLPDPTPARPFGWLGYEEDEYDEIPGKYFATLGIWDEHGISEEVAVVVHRECDGKYPIDGPLARHKEARLAGIVNILNEASSWIDGDIDKYYVEALDSLREIVSEVRGILGRD